MKPSNSTLLWGKALGSHVEREAALHEAMAQKETIHKDVSVQMFSETAVSLLLSYKVEDETALRYAATGLGSGSLGPFQQLFTTSYSCYSWWDYNYMIRPLLDQVAELEDAALAALQAMLLASTMLLTDHKPAGLSLQVDRDRSEDRMRLSFILALSGEINYSYMTAGSKDSLKLGKIHKDIIDILARN